MADRTPDLLRTAACERVRPSVDRCAADHDAGDRPMWHVATMDSARQASKDGGGNIRVFADRTLT